MSDIARITALAAQPDAGEEYERQLRRAYNAVVRSGDIAIDVGAHSGKHSVPLALATGSDGAVIAFEPNPNITPILRSAAENLRRCNAGNVDIREVCVAAEEAESVTFSVIPDRPGWSALHPRPGVTGVEEVTCPQTTLDAAVEPADYERVSFMKIDCEGAEVAVLSGAQQVIERGEPVIHVEVSEAALEATGSSIEDLVEFVVERWTVIDILGNRLPTEGVAAAEFMRASKCYDYLLVPADSASGRGRLDSIKAALRDGFWGQLRDRPGPSLVTRSDGADPPTINAVEPRVLGVPAPISQTAPYEAGHTRLGWDRSSVHTARLSVGIRAAGSEGIRLDRQVVYRSRCADQYGKINIAVHAICSAPVDSPSMLMSVRDAAGESLSIVGLRTKDPEQTISVSHGADAATARMIGFGSAIDFIVSIDSAGWSVRPAAGPLVEGEWTGDGPIDLVLGEDLNNPANRFSGTLDAVALPETVDVDSSTAAQPAVTTARRMAGKLKRLPGRLLR